MSEAETISQDRGQTILLMPPKAKNGMERKHQSANETDIEEVLSALRTATSEEEHRAILKEFIDRRGRERQSRERKLKAEADRAASKINAVKDASRDEELAWFNDLIALYRKLTEEDEPPRY